MKINLGRRSYILIFDDHDIKISFPVANFSLFRKKIMRLSKSFSEEFKPRDKIIIFIVYFLFYPIHLFYKIFYVETWSIYISDSIEELVKGIHSEIFPHSKKFFAADPFFLNEKILYEFAERPFITGKVMSLDNHKEKLTRDLISEKYHLSFPASFKKNSKTYILPEMSTQSYQSIYEIKSNLFQEHNKIRTFLPALVDPVIFNFQGEDFLIGTEAGILQNNLLKIIKLNDFEILEEIQVLKSDGDARNGSKVFTKDGKLFRYAQNNLLYYGHSLTLQEIIIEWPEVSFRNIETLLPPESFDGIHTLDHNGSEYVYDLKKYSFSFLNPLFLLFEKFITYIKAA